jgi:hypothetical protein
VAGFLHFDTRKPQAERVEQEALAVSNDPRIIAAFQEAKKRVQEKP